MEVHVEVEMECSPAKQVELHSSNRLTGGEVELKLNWKLEGLLLEAQAILSARSSAREGPTC